MVDQQSYQTWLISENYGSHGISYLSLYLQRQTEDVVRGILNNQT